jgi:hypothetical protein
MCRRIRCEQCQKPTFAGCGKHIDQVLKDVAPEARCHCKAEAKAASVESTASVAQPMAAVVEVAATRVVSASGPVAAAVYAVPPSKRAPSSAPPSGPVYSSAPSAVCAAPSQPKSSRPARVSTPSPAAVSSTASSQSSPFSSPFSSRPQSRRVA